MNSHGVSYTEHAPKYICSIRGTELGLRAHGESDCRAMEFILLGFPLSRQVELLFLVLLLPTFLLTLLGNLLIISVVLSYSRLHTPMYFFLCNLSSWTSSAPPSFLQKHWPTQYLGIKPSPLLAVSTIVLFLLLPGHGSVSPAGSHVLCPLCHHLLPPAV